MAVINRALSFQVRFYSPSERLEIVIQRPAGIPHLLKWGSKLARKSEKILQIKLHIVKMSMKISRGDMGL
jgi:hypothetical protein